MIVAFTWVRSFARRSVAALGWLAVATAVSRGAELQPGVEKVEFLFNPPPTPACHASTICETSAGLLAGWFGGTAERNKDVCIYLARLEPNGWSAPMMVADGTEDGRERYPTWNPVLYQVKNGPLYLFYKVGPSPSSWWGRYKVSADGGNTWSDSKRLPRTVVGPIRNKPIELPNGTLLCGSSSEDAGWRVHMEQYTPKTKYWNRSHPINDATEFGAIQPTILAWPHGIQILCRTKQRVVTESWSMDGGRTWSKMARTTLPNPNSAIDAVLLRDGRALLVHNHSDSSRGTLGISLSRDGRYWEQSVELENGEGEYSYPAVIEAGNGKVHITYTWKRQNIRYAVVDPSKLPQARRP